MKKTLLAFMTIAVFASCQKNDPNAIRVSQYEKTLHYQEEWQIDAKSGSPITYTSKNEFHAMVSDDGLVTAAFVGSTEIELSNGFSTETIKITVEPEHYLYPDPIVDFGISRTELINRMGRTPDGTTENIVTYKNYFISVPEIMFLFDENNCLKSTGLAVSTAFTKECAAHLAERYLLIKAGSSTEPYLFINGLPDTMTMGISLEIANTSRLLVIYMPLTPSKASFPIMDSYEEVKALFNK